MTPVPIHPMRRGPVSMPEMYPGHAAAASDGAAQRAEEARRDHECLAGPLQDASVPCGARRAPRASVVNPSPW
jgi:hypothetical protein